METQSSSNCLNDQIDTSEYATIDNMVGHRFGRLVSIGVTTAKHSSKHITSVMFRCDCNWVRYVSIQSLKQNGMLYEGCKRCQRRMDKEEAKRLAKLQPPLKDRYKSEYQSWARDKTNFCARWCESFKNFFNDMGPRPPGKVLVKRNPNAKHGPKVSYWGTIAERNTTRYLVVDGKFYSSTEFSEMFNIPLKFVEYHFLEMFRSSSEIFSRWEEAKRNGKANRYK